MLLESANRFVSQINLLQFRSLLLHFFFIFVIFIWRPPPSKGILDLSGVHLPAVWLIWPVHSQCRDQLWSGYYWQMLFIQCLIVTVSQMCSATMFPTAPLLDVLLIQNSNNLLKSKSFVMGSCSFQMTSESLVSRPFSGKICLARYKGKWSRVEVRTEWRKCISLTLKNF